MMLFCFKVSLIVKNDDSFAEKPFIKGFSAKSRSKILIDKHLAVFSR